VELKHSFSTIPLWLFARLKGGMVWACEEQIKK
jgi:hypothetical protein